ncbi:MAG: hypothetical protein QM791_21590 [Ferruginibacter sp.]
MKEGSRQQEILLMVDTSFSCREWLEKNEADPQRRLSKKERLKQACWNGLATDMLPECFINGVDSSLILWEVNEAKGFIDLQYGKYLPDTEKGTSLNPYIFLQEQGYN